jgi:hypothetical protein
MQKRILVRREGPLSFSGEIIFSFGVVPCATSLLRGYGNRGRWHS